MSKRYDVLISSALLGSAVGYGAWWSYTELPGRYMDTEEAIEAYYAGEYRGAYNAFMRLAEEGDARAQLGLAELYWQSVGPKSLWQSAPYWYEQAANQGNAAASYLLAVKVGEYPDNQRLHRLQEAADGGHPIAVARLGSAYLEGKYGIEPDLERGREILANAAWDGNGYAAQYLAYAYLHGPLTTDLKLASDWYAAAVQMGNASALGDLIVTLSSTDSRLWNPEEAYRWTLVAMAWQARYDWRLFSLWDPTEFLVVDPKSPRPSDTAGTQSDSLESGPAAEALVAINNRMRAFAQNWKLDSEPPPELKGLFLGISAERILRAESKALLFLNGHPSPPTEWRLFD